MSSNQFKAFRRWESWLLRTLAAAEQTGSLGMEPPTDRFEVLQNLLQSLHNGCVALRVHSDPLTSMPEEPQIWPSGYPVGLVRCFVGYLRGLPTAAG